MAEPTDLHPYRDRAALDRLLLLIATFVQHPGIGDRDPLEPDTEIEAALELVQTAMQTVAEAQGIQLPHYSIPTLRKDLVTLRRYGILSQRRYRSGYYLGTGGLTQAELRLALNALASLAKHQGDPLARQAQVRLKRRLKGLDLDLDGNLFYPVRAHFNRAIVHTDPDEMMLKQQNRDTLFHELEVLESAIFRGLPVEVYLSRTPYNSQATYRQVYPLQLLYHDIAWYLVMEDFDNGHLAISRIDRFKNHLKILNSTGRGLEAQRSSLDIAHQLLSNGWGLNLGNPTEQQLERQGTLPLVTVKVRFFPPVSRFVEEGERRHPKQKIVYGPKDKQTGEPMFLDYSVTLPERSLNEFSFWVNRYLEYAQFLSPAHLAEKHHQAALALVRKYDVQ